MKNTRGLIAILVILAGTAWVLGTWYQSAIPTDSVEDVEGLTQTEGSEEPGELEPIADSKTTSSEPPAEGAPSDRQVVATDEGEEPSAEAALGGPISRVFGRIEDATGSPIEGVTIFLNTVGEAWAADAKQSSYETESDALGQFEFITPLPTSNWISLSLVPSAFYTITGRAFGVAGGRNKDPLVEGDNDLGLFTLQPTGAIEGILRSADGAALEAARVRLDGSFPGGYSLSSKVEPSGRYVIEHVPAGNYDIEALQKGYLTSKLSSITVRVGEVTQGHDLTIERAPFVSGRVLDEQGTPVERVKVWGWPQSSGQGAGARTNAEGLFTVYLPQDEPYSFTAEKKGYAVFGKEGGQRGVVYSPGTTGIEIQLVKERRTTFLVVDALTGAPIERFGLGVGARPRNGWRSSANRREVPLADHPGGELEAPADPENHVIRVQAPGYAPVRLPVEHESEDVARQEVRLHAEGVLRGRVLFEGQPVVQASVRVERCRFPKPGETRKEEPDIFDDTMTYDLDSYLGRLRILTSDSDGVFELGELATGTYRLELSAKVGSPFILEDIAVTQSEVTDLGDLPLTLGATVRGHVILDGGVSSAGLSLHLDSSWKGAEVVVDGQGNFEFLGVAPGDHSIVVDRMKGVLLKAEPLPFHVDSGQTLELPLDLRPWQTGPLRIRILDSGTPRAGLQVFIQAENAGSRSPRERSNAEGELVVECPRDGVSGITVVSEQGRFVGEATETISVTPGRESSLLIEVESGELTVFFPEDFEIPANGEAQLFLRSESLPVGSGRPVMLTTDTQRRGGVYRAWDGREVSLGRVGVGEYEVTAVVWTRSDESEGQSRQTKSGTFSVDVYVQAAVPAIGTLVLKPDSDE